MLDNLIEMTEMLVSILHFVVRIYCHSLWGINLLLIKCHPGFILYNEPSQDAGRHTSKCLINVLCLHQKL